MLNVNSDSSGQLEWEDSTCGTGIGKGLQVESLKIPIVKLNSSYVMNVLQVPLSLKTLSNELLEPKADFQFN
jgi:hypothetical protein